VNDPFSLIAARQQTHGDFRSTAWVAQTLRDAFRHELGWRDLSTVQREVLDAVAIKIARILSGDANHADHWTDIAGYAELALREIRETKAAAS
jgi:hypothetical protein